MQGLDILEYHFECDNLTEELNRLKTKHIEVSTKFDNTQHNLNQLEPNQSTDQQQAQMSQMLDVSDHAQSSQAQSRKREEAKHQTKRRR